MTDIEKIRFVGRWNISKATAETTSPGAYFNFCFLGEHAVLCFDTQWLNEPVPHLWIQVDGAALIETPIDRQLRIHAQNCGIHMVKVIFKSANEMAHRWVRPLGGCVTLTAIKAELTNFPADNKRTIEFIGDSITEGVLVDYEPGTETGFFERPYDDDSTATYAWLTAENLDMTPIIVGYGGVGVTKGGSGGVPAAPEIYPYCYEGIRRGYDSPNIIVLNYGANDRFSSEEAFSLGYEKLLRTVDKENHGSKIFVVSPFCGVHEEALLKLVNGFNSDRNNELNFISTKGWLPINAPIHPNRYWHKKIAEELTRSIQDKLAQTAE